MTESQLQTKIVEWLKSKGAYVIKTKPGPGVPVGCPDVIGLFPNGLWVALEVKASEKARFQPLQKETIAKLDGMGYARVVYPENWDIIKKQLNKILIL